MKTLIQSTVIALTFSASLAPSALATASTDNEKRVNAYGEPAGFGSVPQVVPMETKDMNFNRSHPGIGGLYVFPGSFDRRNYESHGAWQARVANDARARVIIGPLEVLDSGPTGPMTPEAIDAAREEVTTQVLERIKATDRVMRSLKKQSKDLDDTSRGQFQSAAQEVAQRREALRESLRAVRASGGDSWSNERSTVAVNFNAYVESMHRAEAIASHPANS